MNPASSSAPVSGKIFVSPGVLLTVARLAALSVPGVAGMSPVPGGVNRPFRRGAAQGVRLETRAEEVSAELFLVLHPESDAREVARRVQLEVCRAITEIVGMKVGQVVVHIEDIVPAPSE
jgi:uncharacterized alkaline shock family protein YloU